MLKFRIGAGTMVTLLLALVIVGYTFYRQQVAASQPPVVEREVRGTTAQGIAPAPEFLLRHREELALTAAQVQRVTAVAKAYRQDIAPTQKRLDKASAEFGKYMEGRKRSDHMKGNEAAAQGAEVQRLSSVMATTRHTYWQQARAVLTPVQQQRADKLVPQATLQDLQ